MHSIVLNDLKEKFGDQVLLSPSDIAPIIASSPKVQANLRSQGRFPIPVQKMGAKVGVSIYHLAEYLETGKVAGTSGDNEKIKKIYRLPALRQSKSSARSKEWMMAFRLKLDLQHAFEVELFERVIRMLDIDE